MPVRDVTVDNSQLAAGTKLNGEYPSGVIDWPDGQWQIHVPHGKFGTFNLAIKKGESKSAEVRFPSPRIFAGIDAYNGGSTDATITIRSPEIREESFTLKPGELKRLRTGWRDASSEVIFDLISGGGLLFDNLAYVYP